MNPFRLRARIQRGWLLSWQPSNVSGVTVKIRKTLFVLGTAAALSCLGSANAFALDCTNVSRPAPVQPASPVADMSSVGGPVVYVVQGNWWFISFGGGFQRGFWDFVPPGTASSLLGMSSDQAASLGLPSGATAGSYQAGTGFGLLDKAQAPCLTVRQTTHGIQAESIRCAPSGP